MIRVLIEIIVRSARGRLKQTFGRARSPGFILGLAAVAALFIIPCVLLRPEIPAEFNTVQLTIAKQFQQLAEVAAALVIAFCMSVIWLVPRRSDVLKLNEVEMVYLLPAPVSSRRVIQYAMFRNQPGILFSAGLFALLRNGSGAWTNPLRFIQSAVLIWLFMTVFDLHIKGCGLWKRVRKRRMAAGANGMGISMLVAPIVLVCAFWAVQVPALSEFTGEIRQDLKTLSGDVWNEESLMELFTGRDLSMFTTGLAAAVLQPVRLLIRPLMDSNPGFVSIGMLLILLVVHHEWVVRFQQMYRDMGVKNRPKTAGMDAPFYKIWALFRHSLHSRPFALNRTGPPEIAVIWKSCIQISRISLMRILQITMAAFLGLLLLSFTVGIPKVISGILGFIGVFLTFNSCFLNLGNDIHNDFRNFEMVKTWPISGARLMGAKVAASAMMTAYLGAVGMGLMLISALNSLSMQTSDLFIASAAVPAYAGVSAVFSALHSFSPLLFPHLHMTKDEKEGLADTGRKALMILVMLVVLVLGILPVGILVGGVPLVQQMLGYGIPLWEYPLLGLASLPLFLAEAALLVMILGRLWDNLDPAREIFDAG